nr:MAG TPA: hypothetical protein [Caudoviricetes sp.]
MILMRRFLNNLRKNEKIRGYARKHTHFELSYL